MARKSNQQRRSEKGKAPFVDHLDLPAHYDTTSVTLLVRDPQWLHAYWEISPRDLDALGRQGVDVSSGTFVLRMYDVTWVDFDGTNANHFFDLDVGRDANNWYIHLWSPHVSYCADLGLRTPDGTFHLLARSNAVTTPRMSFSERDDMIWMEVNPGQPQKTYVMADLISRIPRPQKPNFEDRPFQGRFRVPLSEAEIRAYYANLFPLLRLLRLRRKMSRRGRAYFGREYDDEDLELNTEKVPSHGLLDEEYFEKFALGASDEMERRRSKSIPGPGGDTAGASEAFAGRGSEEWSDVQKRKFFFELNAELIVYGRTEPDAQVFHGSRRVDLRPDGTFSLRFAFPDGIIPLDFLARSVNNIDVRRISTSAERTQTRYQDHE